MGTINDTPSERRADQDVGNRPEPLSGICFGAAIFGVFGMRFVDHQVKIGLIAGALLFFAGMHVVRYISPDEEGESAS